MIWLGWLAAVPVLAAVPTYVFGSKDEEDKVQGGDMADEYI